MNAKAKNDRRAKVSRLCENVGSTLSITYRLLPIDPIKERGSSYGCRFSPPDSRIVAVRTMENDAVDRLRELLAKSAERRRAGRWKFVRKIGVLIGIFRAMFQRGHR